MKKVFVIGGAAVDIIGRPNSLCRMRDSNLGSIRVVPGGTAESIAKRLSGYGVETELITAIGKGYHAQLIREDCAAFGVSLTHTLVLDEHTGIYMSTLDEDGEMFIGISDMKIMDHLTPAFFEPLLSTLNVADMVALDTNLSAETLAYLTDQLTVPIFFDPVSCTKAKRIGDRIGRCYAIKPNRFEAAFLSGKSCDTVRGVYRASDWFLAQGVQRVFISLGAEGIYWADGENCGVIPSACEHMVDTIGAGEAMCSGIIAGCLSGFATEQCAEQGNQASAAACAQTDPFSN